MTSESPALETRLQLAIQKGHLAAAEVALRDGRAHQALKLLAAGAVAAEDFGLTLPTGVHGEDRAEQLFTLAQALSGAPRRSWRPSELDKFRFSSDSRFGVGWSIYKDTGRLHDLSTGEIRTLDLGNSGTRALFVSRNGRTVLQLSNYEAALFDGPSGARLATLNEAAGQSRCGALSDDGAVAATCGDLGTYLLWDARTGEELARGTCAAWRWNYSLVAVSPDGRRAYFVDQDGQIAMRDGRSGLELHRFGFSDVQTHLLVVSPDGHRLAAVHQKDLEDPFVALYDARSGALQIALPPCHNVVRAATFASDSASIALCAREAGVKIYDAASGALIRRLPTDEEGAYRIALSSNGALAAISHASEDRARLFCLETGEERASFPLPNQYDAPLAFSLDDQQLLIGAPPVAYDARQTPPLARLVGHGEARWRQTSIRRAAFSPDGRRVLTGGDDDTLRLWDADSGVERARIDLADADCTVDRLAFSPDGSQFVAVLIGNDAYVGDGHTGEVLFKASEMNDGALFSNGPSGGGGVAQFSPCGERLAILLDGGQFILWDAKARKPILLDDSLPFWGVNGVAFSPDSRQIALAVERASLSIRDFNSGAKLHNLDAEQHPEDCWGEQDNPLYLPDGRLITIDACNDEAGSTLIEIWNSEGERVEHAFSEIYNADLFIDLKNNVIICTNSEYYEIWAINPLRNLASYEARTRNSEPEIYGQNGVFYAAFREDLEITLLSEKKAQLYAILKRLYPKVAKIQISPEGERALIRDGNEARILDVSQLALIAEDPGLALAAALDRGVGRIEEDDRTHLFLREAPEDLHEALKLGLDEDRRATLREMTRRLQSLDPAQPRQEQTEREEPEV